MTDLEELAERCEKASDPDRELDADIAVAIYGGEIVWKTANYTMEQYPVRRAPSANHVGGFANNPVEAHTASIDAAMTLVDGVLLHLSDIGADGLPYAVVGNPGNSTEGKGIARTLPLSLTAAALRARK